MRIIYDKNKVWDATQPCYHQTVHLATAKTTPSLFPLCVHYKFIPEDNLLPGTTGDNTCHFILCPWPLLELPCTHRRPDHAPCQSGMYTRLLFWHKATCTVQSHQYKFKNILKLARPFTFAYNESNWLVTELKFACSEKLSPSDPQTCHTSCQS